MQILVDMNLSPRWCPVLERHGHSCVHWSDIGDPRADDEIVMSWALDRGFVVLTHDLDFGAVLASTKACAPSVIQLRTRDVLPSALESRLAWLLREYEAQLAAGALIVVDEVKSRVRVLPLTT